MIQICAECSLLYVVRAVGCGCPRCVLHLPALMNRETAAQRRPLRAPPPPSSQGRRQRRGVSLDRPRRRRYPRRDKVEVRI